MSNRSNVYAINYNIFKKIITSPTFLYCPICHKVLELRKTYSHPNGPDGEAFVTRCKKCHAICYTTSEIDHMIGTGRMIILTTTGIMSGWPAFYPKNAYA
jgi:hypothetical protein